jgi:hypothetical protein
MPRLDNEARLKKIQANKAKIKQQEEPLLNPVWTEWRESRRALRNLIEALEALGDQGKADRVRQLLCDVELAVMGLRQTEIGDGGT